MILKPDEFGLGCDEKKARAEKFGQPQSALPRGNMHDYFCNFLGGTGRYGKTEEEGQQKYILVKLLPSQKLKSVIQLG